MIEPGLRVGEILALRWSRVHMDGENPYIDVIDNAVEVKDRSNGVKISLTIDTPKSKSSRRRVPHQLRHTFASRLNAKEARKLTLTENPVCN